MQVPGVVQEPWLGSQPSLQIAESERRVFELPRK